MDLYMGICVLMHMYIYIMWICILYVCIYYACMCTYYVYIICSVNITLKYSPWIKSALDMLSAVPYHSTEILKNIFYANKNLYFQINTTSTIVL